MVVDRARKVYLNYQGAAYNDYSRNSMYARAKGQYAAIMSVDRYLREEYESLTTAMLTRRLSPIEDGQWLTPWTLDQRLHDSGLRESVTNALRYQFEPFDWEYIGVTAATDSAATPHEHIYCWIDDPDDEVTVGHLESALQKHLDKCKGAYEDDHEYRRDGSYGAITIRHEPTTVDGPPDSFRKIREYRKEHGGIPEGEPLTANTIGAQYIASQLPHLVLGNVYDGTRDVSDIRIEGAAVAWGTPSKWFRTSGGIPAVKGR
jgi:hypothetical protein